MSAPLRPLDENSKSILQKRRPLRRRKVTARNVVAPSAGDFDDFQDEVFNTDCATLEELLDGSTEKVNKGNKKSTLVPPPPATTRSRSVLGTCDVETLVSMLSSGGSDSEREDAKLAEPKSNESDGRTPSIRKLGKSGKTYRGSER